MPDSPSSDLTDRLRLILDSQWALHQRRHELVANHIASGEHRVEPLAQELHDWLAQCIVGEVNDSTHQAWERIRTAEDPDLAMRRHGYWQVVLELIDACMDHIDWRSVAAAWILEQQNDGT